MLRRLSVRDEVSRQLQQQHRDILALSVILRSTREAHVSIARESLLLILTFDCRCDPSETGHDSENRKNRSEIALHG